MQIGDTFYWKDRGHLWIVISDPLKNNGQFIIVNLTKDVFRAGKECELRVGDHAWVVQNTYVSFGDAKKLGIQESANLGKCIADGTIRNHNRMKDSVLQKIIAAAKVSKAIPSGFVSLL